MAHIDLNPFAPEFAPEFGGDFETRTHRGANAELLAFILSIYLDEPFLPEPGS